MTSSCLSWERRPPAGRAPSRAAPPVRLQQQGLQTSSACCTLLVKPAAQCKPLLKQEAGSAWNTIVHYQLAGRNDSAQPNRSSASTEQAFS